MLAIRRRPQVLPEARCDHLFQLRIGHHQFCAYAYQLFGPNCEHRMRWEKQLGEGRVGEQAVKLHSMYECVRSNSLCQQNGGPLEFVSRNGNAEYMQQLHFVSVCAKRINGNAMRNPKLHTLQVFVSNAVEEAAAEPGKLVCAMVHFTCALEALRDIVSLDVLLNSRSPTDREVFVYCPLALIPSGREHFGLQLQRWRDIGAFRRSPVCCFEVAQEMLMHTNAQRSEEERMHAEAELYPNWYGRYLVSGRSVFVDVWPAPCTHRRVPNFATRKGSFFPSLSMRDNEPVSFSLDALHCLLAGLVRFHCERMKHVRSRTTNTTGEDIEAVHECLYTATVAHPQMSLRDLMRQQGFAALCRQVYRVLFYYQNCAPQSRRRAEWFRDTLTHALSFVLQMENVGDSENETLRVLQGNALVEYDDELDEKMYAQREEIVEPSRIPAAGSEYMVRVRRAGSRKGDNDIIDYYMDVLPALRQRVRLDDGNNKQCDEAIRELLVSKVLWIFEVRMELYFSSLHRGCQTSIKKRDVIFKDGYAQLTWLHLTAVRDMEAAEVAKPYNTPRHQQPWLADLFALLISAQCTYGKSARINTNDRSFRNPFLPHALRPRFDHNVHDSKITRTINGSNAQRENSSGSSSDEEDDPSLRDTDEMVPRKIRRTINKSLLLCLPLGNGLFAANRKLFLRDFPLKGNMRKEFVRAFGADAAMQTKPRDAELTAKDEKDLVHCYPNLIASDDVLADYAFSSVHNEEGDEGVLYNDESRTWVTMKTAHGVAQLSTGEDNVQQLFDKQLMPPCMVQFENDLKDNNKDFKNWARVDYSNQMRSHTGLIDIEDVATHVENIEKNMSRRSGKIQKHVGNVLNTSQHYESKHMQDIEFEVAQGNGRVRNTCGALSCAQIIGGNMPTVMRCPYAGSGDNSRGIRKTCASNAGSGSEGFVLKYPRDYTRLKLHLQSDQ